MDKEAVRYLNINFIVLSCCQLGAMLHSRLGDDFLMKDGHKIILVLSECTIVWVSRWRMNCWDIAKKEALIEKRE